MGKKKKKKPEIRADTMQNMKDGETLGLDSVLYNPKTGEMYTPNTNAVQQLEKLTPPEGGEKNES